MILNVTLYAYWPYSEHQSLIRYRICKYSFPFCGSSFYSVNSMFPTLKIFILHYIKFFFILKNNTSFHLFIFLTQRIEPMDALPLSYIPALFTFLLLLLLFILRQCLATLPRLVSTLVILLSHAPECWNYRHVPPYLELFLILMESNLVILSLTVRLVSQPRNHC